MKLKQLGPNRTQLTYSDGLEVLWSYETPVAAKLADGTYVKTSTKWSATTSRHINQWLDGVNAVEVPQEAFTESHRRTELDLLFWSRLSIQSLLVSDSDEA